jgi:DNA-binding NtrC family response regulator
VLALRSRIAALIDSERGLSDDTAPTVLIQGETGTGKALVARALHFGGRRGKQPFVELNCGALPAHRVEAELFGYERGAFTDAHQRKLGLIETAEGGTLFLDEIGEAGASTQVKLLKLLEDRRLRRLGGLGEQSVNVRVICASNRPLAELVRDGRFRADLFYRLRVVEIQMPPLAATRVAPDDLNLERMERRLIEAALQRTGDNVTQAARLLGVSRDTLRYRLDRLELRRGAVAAEY